MMPQRTLPLQRVKQVLILARSGVELSIYRQDKDLRSAITLARQFSLEIVKCSAGFP